MCFILSHKISLKALYCRSVLTPKTARVKLPKTADLKMQAEATARIFALSQTAFIKEHCPNLSSYGNFVTKDGSVIAKHKGIINYTVGQRKGLGISAPAPYYVLSKDSESGDVILGSNDDLFSCYLTAKNVNFISIEALTEPMQVKAKIRYNQKEEADSLITPLANGRVEVEFAKPQRAITPGQSVVFYDGDVVVGGGVIE